MLSRDVATYGLLDGPNPTEDDLQDPVFLAIWEAIKHWDLSRERCEPHRLYAGATGSDVMVILNAVRSVQDA